MWWFSACHANLLLLLRRFAAAGPVLDAGCGTGGLLAKLGAGAVGLDADAFACSRARAKSGRPVCAGSVNRLPFADRAFAAIVSADVLCHGGVEEAEALAQFRRCLAPGGVLVLNLPAYRWLLSRHDEAVYNVRRYTRRGVAALLAAAGFRLAYAGYWNAGLFPLMVATRKLLPGGGSDVHPYPAPVEALCRMVTAAERLVLRAGLRLPFGGSLVAVATREDADA